MRHFREKKRTKYPKRLKHTRTPLVINHCEDCGTELRSGHFVGKCWSCYKSFHAPSHSIMEVA